MYLARAPERTGSRAAQNHNPDRFENHPICSKKRYPMTAFPLPHETQLLGIADVQHAARIALHANRLTHRAAKSESGQPRSAAVV